jgi:hypothetical protein
MLSGSDKLKHKHPPAAVSMRVAGACAVVLSLVVLASTTVHAQSKVVRAATVGGTHAVTFGTVHGTVSVYLASDAAPGDRLAGRIHVAPAGATPLAREENVRLLNGFSVDFAGQQTSVASGRYEWLVPLTLRSGMGMIAFRDAQGTAVSESSVPIDPLPAPVPVPASADNPPAIPAEGETGRTAIIRGRFDRGLTGATLTLGGADVELLSSSPRQLAFRVPAVAGVSPLRFTSGERVVTGMLRAIDVQLSASRTQLFRNQRAELTATVRGLDGITTPVTLTLVNLSPAAVRIDDIDRPITIEPGQVRRGGTVVITRRMTGIQPGPFEISAGAGRPPLAQFDVSRHMIRTLVEWQAMTGVTITAGANALIQSAVLGARRQLDEFLSQQRAHQGDVQDVFAALLSHYSFDLRDDAMVRRRAVTRLPVNILIRPAPPAQNRAAGVEITANEVRGPSFSDFLTRLVGRFTARQAVGYLFVRSLPVEAPITVDRQRRNELTDRRLVMPAGEHDIVVAASTTCRQRVTVHAFQTELLECGR